MSTGGLIRVGDAPQPCLSPEHNPPNNIFLEPGVYEYTCPSCGQKVTFTVLGIYCTNAPSTKYISTGGISQ